MYAVQTTELPGVIMNHQQENTRVGRIILQGDILEYNPIEITLVVDEKLTVWRDIIALMQKYHIQGTNTCESISSEYWLELRDNRNNYMFRISLHNCYLRSVSNLEYSTSKENEILLLRITLDYDYFDIV
jgi:hypothetical protein